MSQRFLFHPAREELAPPPESRQRRQEAAESERRKAEGMALAAAPRERLLGHAREIAFDIAHGKLPHADGTVAANGLCHADDVFMAWKRENDKRERQGLACVPWIGNAAGSIFTSGNWEFSGVRVKSQRPHAHANELKVWRWKHE